jgi:Na+/proline symporter
MNTSKGTMPLDDSKEGRDFEKLVMWASSFSIAVLAALLASLKQVNPSIVLRFSVATILAFVGGAVLTPLFLRVVMHGSKKRRAILVIAAAIVSVLTYFLFGIENTSQENRTDVTIGTAIAVMVLSFVAWVLWRLARFLESDQQENRDNPR